MGMIAHFVFGRCRVVGAIMNAQANPETQARPSSGASGSASISAPFNPVTGGSRATPPQPPYLMIGIGAVVAFLLYKSLRNRF